MKKKCIIKIIKDKENYRKVLIIFVDRKEKEIYYWNWRNDAYELWFKSYESVEQIEYVLLNETNLPEVYLK